MIIYANKCVRSVLPLVSLTETLRVKLKNKFISLKSSNMPQSASVFKIHAVYRPE